MLLETSSAALDSAFDELAGAVDVFVFDVLSVRRFVTKCSKIMLKLDVLFEVVVSELLGFV